MNLKAMILKTRRDPIAEAGSDRLQRILAQQKAEAAIGHLGRLSIQAPDPKPPETTEPLYPLNVYDSSLD